MRAPVHKPVRWDSGQVQHEHNVRSAFYRTPAWRAVRSFVLKRDGYLCQLRLPGCQVRATIADHIAWREGSAEAMARRTSVPPALPAITSGTRRRAAALGDRGVEGLTVRGRESGGGEVRDGTELGGGSAPKSHWPGRRCPDYQTLRTLACTALSRNATSMLALENP
jgi:hypothetical protein